VWGWNHHWWMWSWWLALAAVLLWLVWTGSRSVTGRSQHPGEGGTLSGGMEPARPETPSSRMTMDDG
jgi:hypothetical protein